MTSKLMELIDNNKEKIEDGDYVKMCSILLFLNKKENIQYKIKYYKISYDNRFGRDENLIINQNIKIKTKIVIIENPEVIDYLYNISSSNDDIEEINLKLNKRDNNIYLEIEDNKYHSYHIIYEETEKTLECGINYNKILIINYMKYEPNEPILNYI